jgi:hypothetical protein
MTNLARMMAWTLVLTIVALSLGPACLRPVTGLPRWAEHATIFAALGAAFAISYRGRIVMLLSIGDTSAVVLQVMKFAVPERHARFNSVLIEVMSASIAIICCSAILRKFTRSEEAPRP